ncbi:adaptor protein MecA [Enterococcus songbeiensis]|uniref:adaptor protein MecA n=1 Tax=Enterococcus songbeiensis TaxID=2559927 RepID=UPI0010F68AF6|nr:adaptor protein MecA [Enterococcus songbeiensis]
MEMEHINENTIRVMIKGEDLAARGITFLDLLGNQNEIENFFYSILEEVDIDEEFKGSDAVTFQVLPKGDGLELFISKNLQPEDLSQFEEMGSGSPEEITDFLKKHVADQLEENTKPEEVKRHFVLEMVDFEQMIQLANEVQLDCAITDLYEMNDFYFLEIQFLDELILDSEVKDSLSHLSEFARKSHVTPEVLAEHGKQLMEHDALALTRHYFH